MSKFDLEQAKQRFDENTLDGIDEIPVEHKQVVFDTFKTGEIVQPPKLEAEVPAKAKKSRAKKKVIDDEDEEEAPKPKRTRKKHSAKDSAASDGKDEAPRQKRARKIRVVHESDDAGGAGDKAIGSKLTDEVDGSDDEVYVPRKTRSRQVPVEVVDPVVARIQTLTEQMRKDATN